MEACEKDVFVGRCRMVDWLQVTQIEERLVLHEKHNSVALDML